MEEKSEKSATMGENKENKTSNVQVNYQLKEICDKADGRLLIDCIAQNKKEGGTFRKELLVAFSNDPDMVKLAMKALESFDFSDSANRRVCIFLLECLYPIFGNDDSDAVPLDVKNLAREIAKVWRNRIKKRRGLDSRAFLQLLISFRIATDYEKDELLEILIPASTQKEAPDMCRSLGLSPDADFIDKVSKNCGRIGALKVAHAFGMMDKVDPVGLLTSFLRDVENDITEMRADDPDASQLLWTEADSKKMGVLRSISVHVERLGLQCDSFKDNLVKEIRKLGLKKRGIKKARRKEEKKKRREAKRKEDASLNAAEKKEEEKEDGKKAAEKKAQEKQDGQKDAEKKARLRENYALKRAKISSPNEATRVAGGSDSSEAFSAANRISTGLAACAFTSALPMAAQLNDARRRHEGYLSALGTSNLTPIGSSLYSSGFPAGAFSVPLSNVADVNYKGRAEQIYMSNFGEVNKNHVRASVDGTGNLAKSSATESNYNFEGRGPQSYKLNFGEIGNNLFRASAYATGVLVNTSATQCHYERRGPELYTSTLGGRLTGSIGSSVYGSNPRTIPSSDVNQGSYETGLGQYSGFAGRNMLPVVSSGYGSIVSTVPPSGFAVRNMVPVVSSGYGSTVSTVPPSGFDGRNMVPVVSSGYGSTVSTVPPSGFAGRNMVPVVSSGYGSTVYTAPPSRFAGRNMVPVVSSGYESSVSTVPASGFAGRNMVPVVSSGYGSTVSTVPPSSVTEGHFERRRSVIDKYQFNIG